MKNFALIFVLLCLPVVSQAEQGQSTMLDNQDPFYDKRSGNAAAEEQADHCTQLRQRMNELKGRPLSRNAVIRRYRVECKPGYEMPGQSRLR
ncbi:MAG: hypothetical protein ACC648_06490 [Thiohalobacterales bacterium]